MFSLSVPVSRNKSTLDPANLRAFDKRLLNIFVIASLSTPDHNDLPANAAELISVFLHCMKETN